MNITKEQADKVIAALETIFGEGLSWREIAEAHKEAITITRGLADAEPVCNHEWFQSGAMLANEKRCIKCGEWGKLYTSPQAALKSELSAQAALARLPSEGKPIEALAPTEAQEREAFEAFMLTKYPAHLCHWVGDQYSEMFTRLVFVGWKAGRAGSKP